MISCFQCANTESYIENCIMILSENFFVQIAFAEKIERALKCELVMALREQRQTERNRIKTLSFFTQINQERIFTNKRVYRIIIYSKDK